MKKKSVSILLCIALTTVMLNGCGTSDNSPLTTLPLQMRKQQLRNRPLTVLP